MIINLYTVYTYLVLTYTCTWSVLSLPNNINLVGGYNVTNYSYIHLRSINHDFYEVVSKDVLPTTTALPLQLVIPLFNQCNHQLKDQPQLPSLLSQTTGFCWLHTGSTARHNTQRELDGIILCTHTARGQCRSQGTGPDLPAADTALPKQRRTTVDLHCAGIV